MARRMRWLALFVLLLWPGCFPASPLEDSTCVSARDCPDRGATCVNGYCVLADDPATDAGADPADTDARPDGGDGQRDTMPDMPGDLADVQRDADATPDVAPDLAPDSDNTCSADGDCDDGVFCNGPERCDPVAEDADPRGCLAGEPPQTDDGVDCTADSCSDVRREVVHEPDDELCDDGRFCNGAEVCDLVRGCLPGMAPPLSDGVGCTADSCDDDADEVVHEPDDELCNDNLFCNGVETCDAVRDCQAGVAPEMDDGLDCTMDSCNEGLNRVDHTRIEVDGYVCIEPGSFTMGSPENELGRFSDESPTHEVEITRGFLLKATEVTQAQWLAVMETSPSYFVGRADNPVEQVSWWDALEYVNRLSADEGLTPCYTLTGCSGTPGGGCDPNDGYCTGDFSCSSVTFRGLDCEGYRLPTEAEWEYAARAGTQTALYNGGITQESCEADTNLSAIGWYCGNSTNTTHAVRGKLPNPQGLYDTSGNVYEWVWDWYGSSYYGQSPDRDPLGPSTGDLRVRRGGSWDAYARYCRSANRDFSPPAIRYHAIGVRPSRSIP